MADGKTTEFSDQDRQDLAELGAIVAKLNALARPGVALSNGTKLYLVERGWESTMIRESSVLTIATTVRELENALRNPDFPVVFVPFDALVTDTMIETLCRRIAVTKTILKEVEKEA